VLFLSENEIRIDKNAAMPSPVCAVSVVNGFYLKLAAVHLEKLFSMQHLDLPISLLGKETIYSPVAFPPITFNSSSIPADVAAKLAIFPQFLDRSTSGFTS
jgi:hypothetical protein